MLEQARTLEDVKDVLDVAVAAKKYAEAKHLGEEAQRYAAEIVLRASQRMGQMLPAIMDHGGDRRSEVVSSSTRELEIPANISAKQQWTARQIATIPEPVFEKFVTNGRELTQKRALRIAREHKAAERRAEVFNVEPVNPSIDARHGDFREVLQDVEGVDAIITDPPYPQAFVTLFYDFGHLAARVLKPNGIAAVMVGQTHLLEYLQLLSAHLNYRWTGAYLTSGPRTRMHQAKVATGWKPILFFQRKDAADISFLLDDVFASGADDKRFHHWGQSESGFASLIERLTSPGALIVDPFLGGGTTAVVCRDLGRRFIGCDIDADAIATTRERLAA